MYSFMIPMTKYSGVYPCHLSAVAVLLLIVMAFVQRILPEPFVANTLVSVKTTPSFDLVLNVYISNEKRAFDRNRFDRLDIFIWTLHSYSKLRSLSRAFLCVELSEEYLGKKESLEIEIHSLFGKRLQLLSWSRVTQQEDWKSLIFEVGQRDGSTDDKLVWFIQNDDHPFIDFNQDILEEGLERLRAEGSKFRALYPSHWPEILNLAGKYSTPVMCGSFVKVNVTILDGLLFMNFGFVRYLVDELQWSAPMRRMDSLLLDSRVWGFGNWRYDLMTLFVPLRELCRKFDGYQAQGISAARVPYLILPPEKNRFDRSMPSLIRMLTSDEPVGTLWCRGNHFALPPEFVGRIAELHIGELRPSERHCVQLSGEFCNAKRPFARYNSSETEDVSSTNPVR